MRPATNHERAASPSISPSASPSARGLSASEVTDSAVAGSELSARELSLAYGDRAIVENLSVELPAGKVTIIVGANACGKSTLLRGLARLLKPSSGVVHLDGTDIHKMPTRELARKLGILPQTPTAPDGISVADLVGRGRSPHQGWFRQWNAADDDAVAAALNVTGTAELANRSIDELSGGQRQRVWIAMALAQETDVLLLDEPTTYLDLAHQVEVLDVVSELNARRGITVAIVLHDLNLAARYADHLIAMKHGDIVAQGAPASVLTAELVQEVFGLESVVVPDPVVGTPMVVPVGRRAALLADAAAQRLSVSESSGQEQAVLQQSAPELFTKKFSAVEGVQA